MLSFVEKNNGLNFKFKNKKIKFDSDSLFMSIEKTYPKLDFVLVYENDIGSIIYRIYENNIFHVIVKEGERVTMEMVENGYKFLEQSPPGKYYNIYEFKSFADVDPEVREWSSNSTESKYSVSDAIVINNIGQKILADFYLKFNKPKQPTKIFTSVAKAIEWIEILRKNDLT